MPPPITSTRIDHLCAESTPAGRRLRLHPLSRAYQIRSRRHADQPTIIVALCACDQISRRMTCDIMEERHADRSEAEADGRRAAGLRGTNLLRCELRQDEAVPSHGQPLDPLGSRA